MEKRIDFKRNSYAIGVHAMCKPGPGGTVPIILRWQKPNKQQNIIYKFDWVRFFFIVELFAGEWINTYNSYWHSSSSYTICINILSSECCPLLFQWQNITNKITEKQKFRVSVCLISFLSLSLSPSIDRYNSNLALYV